MSNGLVLTRSTKENDNELYFTFESPSGDEFTIKQVFTKVRGGLVRCCIVAPQEVKVVRGELLKKSQLITAPPIDS